MLSYKMDFSSCNIMPGFGKPSHNYACILHQIDYKYIMNMCQIGNFKGLQLPYSCKFPRAQIFVIFMNYEVITKIFITEI